MNIGILLFDDVEVLDFAGPFEIFSAATDETGQALFRVFTISEKGQPVRARNGLTVQCDFSIYNHPKLHLLVVPGGEGSRKVVEHHELIDWVASEAHQTDHCLSICTGARILAKAGLLSGQQFTTHHSAHAELQEAVPDGQLLPHERFTDNGAVKTSAGVMAGIDLSLYVVGQIFGESVLQRLKVYLEYIK